MPVPDLSHPSLTIVPWEDPVIAALGYPAGSTYVERFWLPILGPSTSWLVRHLDDRLSSEPDGAVLDLDTTAAALGLGAGRGRHSPLVRALHRCCQFGLARAVPDAHLAVRRHLPPLTRHQVDRLPTSVQAQHVRWRTVERDASILDPQQRRARHMALGLAELGEDVGTTEQRLIRMECHPVVAHDAARWAHRLVRASRESSADDGPDKVGDVVPEAVAEIATLADHRPPPPAHLRPKVAPPAPPAA